MLKYTMIAYKAWDGEVLRTERSNNLAYFDRYKNKQNFRIVIKEGCKVIYSELWKGWV